MPDSTPPYKAGFCQTTIPLVATIFPPHSATQATKFLEGMASAKYSRRDFLTTLVSLFSG